MLKILVLFPTSPIDSCSARSRTNNTMHTLETRVRVSALDDTRIYVVQYVVGRRLVVAGAKDESLDINYI